MSTITLYTLSFIYFKMFMKLKKVMQVQCFTSFTNVSYEMIAFPYYLLFLIIYTELFSLTIIILRYIRIKIL
jgi:hypothetical protein